MIFFPNLDGIRFICFFMVFMVHSLNTDDSVINNNPFHVFVKEFLFASGNLGVNMFFVLSGFLITYLLISEKDLAGKINIPNFYLRRVLRIWPLYFFCVFFGFVIFPIIKTTFGEVPNETAQPIYYFFFLSNFDLIRTGGADSSMLNILWSVSIEEQFYLIWPLVVSFTRRKYLWLVTIIIIIISTIFRILNSRVSFIESHTLSAATDLGIGCLTACIAIQNKETKSTYIKNSKGIYIAAHLFFILVFLSFKPFNLYYLDFVKRIIFSSSFAFIIYLQCFSNSNLFSLSKLKTISKLGQYTYGLYCLHMLGILFSMKIFNKMMPGYNIYIMFLVIFPLSYLLSLMFAKFSYRYFESYFLKLKSKFSIITKG